MAELGSEAAERHLAYQVHVQAETLARKGVSPELIERQCREFDTAVRAALRRLAPLLIISGDAS